MDRVVLFRCFMDATMVVISICHHPLGEYVFTFPSISIKSKIIVTLKRHHY